ncbi:MAG TPA: hypothetical protein VHL57_11100, partial [Flavobacteriales bacterium]|nr:hypothetical protein [Flavobacteriales bacterium]
FLTVYSGYYGRLPDKQRVALTYLMDHILKFHPTSFSFYNLELAPETIAVNKVPEMRKFTNDIIQRILGIHLRKVDNGLFDYQFRARTYTELSYLSKVSEPDAAALNFTLDESLPVKRHFYRRLHEQQRERRRMDADERGWEREQRRQSFKTLDRIPDLHLWLGDLHFFDTEFDEALDHYRAAAAFYAPRVEAPAWQGPRIQDEYALERFHEYVKATLRQILCLEKMKATDDALVLSGSLSRSVLEYLDQHKGHKDAERSNWKLMLLALVIKPALVEKQGRYGLKLSDLEDLAECAKILNGIPGVPKAWFHANMCQQLALILHFRGPDIAPQPAPPLPRPPLSTALLSANLPLTNGQLPLSALESLTMGLCDLLGSVTPLPPLLYRPRDLLALCVRFLEGPFAEKDKQWQELFCNMLVKYGDVLMVSAAAAQTEVHHHLRFNNKLVFPGNIIIHDLVRTPQFGCTYAAMIVAAKAALLLGNGHLAVTQLIKLLQILERDAAWTQGPKAWEEVEQLWEWAKQHFPLTAQLSAQPIVERWRAHVGDLVKYPIYRTALQDIAHDEALRPYRGTLVELDCLWYRLHVVHHKAMPSGWAAFKQGIACASLIQYPRLHVLELVLAVNDRHYAPGGADAEQHIENSIPACVDLIMITERMGISSLYGHLMLAEAYAKLGDWCERLRQHSNKVVLEANLKKRLGVRFASRMHPQMHLAKAIDHYGLANEMHARGGAYKRVMDDMFIAEDDLNDHMVHFACAYERMCVHLDKGFEKKIRALKHRLLHRMDITGL